MRSSSRAIQRRVSSSVDQMMCCTPACLCRSGHRSGLGHLPFRRKMLPVVGDAKRRRRPRKGPSDAGLIVEVRRDHVGSGFRQLHGLPRARVSGQPAGREAAGRIAEDRADQATSLRSGCANDRNHFSIAHRAWPESGRSISRKLPRLYKLAVGRLTEAAVRVEREERAPFTVDTHGYVVSGCPPKPWRRRKADGLRMEIVLAISHSVVPGATRHETLHR